MQEEILRLVAGTVAPAVVRFGASAVRSRLAPPAFEVAAGKTAEAFPHIPGLEPALAEWSRGQDFVALSQELAGPSPPDARRYLASFAGLTEFFSRGAFRTEDALEALRFYFEELKRDLYNGDDGHAQMMDRIEEIGRSLHERFDELGYRELERYAHLEQRGELDPHSKALVDLGRLRAVESLLDEGRERTAQRLLDGLLAERVNESDSREVQFTLRSVLGRTALAQGNHRDAIRYFRSALEVERDHRLARLRLAVALSEADNTTEAEEVIADVELGTDLSDRELTNAINALSAVGRVDDVEALADQHSHLLSRPRVAIALASALSEAGRDVEATQRLGHCRRTMNSRDLIVEALYAGLLINRAGELVESNLASAIGLARESVAVSAGIEEEVSGWERPGARIHYRLGYARALGITGHWTESIRQCDLVLREQAAHPVAVLMKANALSSLGRSSAVIEVLSDYDAPSTGEARMAARLRAAALLVERHPSRAYENALLALDWEQIDAEVLDLLVRASDAAGLDCSDLLEALLHQTSTERQAQIARARRLLRCGQRGEAGSIVDELLADRGNLAPELLAAVLLQTGRYDDAAGLLRPLAVDSVQQPAAVLLLRALHLGGKLDEAQELARLLIEVDWALIDAAEVLADSADYMGDIEGTLHFTTMLGRLRPLDATTRHAEVLDLLRVGRREDAIALVRTLRSIDLAGSPDGLLQLAQLAHVLGDTESALELAYRARRLGDDRPDIHLGYVGLLHKLLPAEFAPASVRPGVGLQLTSEAGSSVDLLVLEWGEEPASELELPPNTHLARTLIGKEVGAEVLDASLLLPGRWVVKELRSRYGFMARVTFKTFESRFGRDAGLTAIPFSDGDPSAVFAQLDARAEYVRRWLELYEEWRLPLGAFASAIGVARSQLWLAAARSSGMEFAIRFQPSLRSALTAFTGDDPPRSLVFDASAIRTVAALDIAPVVLQSFEDVSLPQAVIDQFLQEELEARSQDADPGSMGAAGDGKYFMLEPSVESRDQRLADLERAIAAAQLIRPRSIPVDALLGDRALHDKRAELLGADAYRALQLAKATGAALVTDDAALAAIARNDFTLVVGSTQALMRSMLAKGTFDTEAYREGLATLVSGGYRYVAINAEELQWLVASGDRPTWLGAFAQLQGEACPADAAVALLVPVLYRCWLYEFLEDSFEEMVRDALHWLRVGRDTGAMEMLVQSIARLSSAVPLVRDPRLLADLVSRVDSKGES